MAEAEEFALNESPYPSPEDVYDDVFVGYIQGEMGLEKTTIG